MMLPRPRGYVDWVVPQDEAGNDIGICSDTETFNFYINWLADYLFYTDIPVPDNQLETLEDFRKDNGIRCAVFWTSDDWGFSAWDTELIEESFINGTTYKELRELELEHWNELSQSDQEIFEDPEAECFTSEIEYKRIGEEKIESMKVPEHIQHADIPYRAIFAKLLKPVTEKEERIKHLKYFYYNFNECATK